MRLGRCASTGWTRRPFELPSFESVPIESEAEHGQEEDELLLTEMVARAGAAEADELLLDDILETIDPEARVVRLFRTSGVPTPGELQARIERHRRSKRPRPVAADASEALHEVLAALRQSLR